MKPPIRWTLQQAGAEFGIDPATLSNRLRAASIAAGDDKRFSTKEILTAIAGDLDRQKTRNEGAKADLNEMKRDLDERRLIPAEAARDALDRLRAAISKVIAASPLAAKQRAAIAGNLEKLNDLFA
jgi:phage terminase Nu1 subunit (DNA packaging protein)